MSQPDNEIHRKSSTGQQAWRSRGRVQVLSVAGMGLAAFAAGFMWGPFADNAAIAIAMGIEKSPESSDQAPLQPHGHAAWDHRPLRVADDLPLASLRWLPPLEQLTLVDALPRGDALSDAQAQGLRQLIADGSVIDVVRNNAANRLIQRADDPQLWKFFAAMHADEDEGAVWRDYSLQFLAMSVRFAEDQEAAMAVLAQIAAEAPEAFAGTALLHLARLGGTGLSLPPHLVATVIEQRLDHPDTPDALRHTCLALIGEGQHQELLPLARRELQRADAGPDALRGALYAVGRLGDANDRLALEAFLSHSHPAVVMAAQAAVARLSRQGQAAAASDNGDRS